MATAVKWQDPAVTAGGKPRASVAPTELKTLWFNTGTLCNIECARCYIESSPKNDRLAYLSAAEVRTFLDEIAREKMPVREIGFTGGEPFLNPELCSMAAASLERGFEVLILTNAMKPLANKRAGLLALKYRFQNRLRLRVSLDHYTARVHDKERGEGAFEKALAGLLWLSDNGFSASVAGRVLPEEGARDAREGYGRLFAARGLRLDAASEVVIFPEMDARKEFPEITVDCWGLLRKNPADVMCSSSRMVIKQKGEERPVVASCTLLPYDERFLLGKSLKESWRPVSLLHPHCAAFCVLGGASCGA